LHERARLGTPARLGKKCNRYLQWGMIEAAQKAKVIDPFLRAKAEKLKGKYFYT